jgi:hypothetical protein
MTDATIFNEGGSTNETPTTPEATTDGQLFPALVGDGQKYKTPEELAKAYSNADQFIEQLKDENRKLREQAASAKTIDEVLERMSTQREVPEYDNSPAQEFNPDIVQQLVEKTLVGREQSQRKTNNLLQADKLMKDRFGDKALEVFQQKASTPEKAKILMELAAADPVEFASMFAGTPSVTNNMDTGSMNTTSVSSTVGNRASIEGTKEWAAKVRAENPSQYWSQEFQYKLQQTVTKNPTLYFGQ